MSAHPSPLQRLRAHDRQIDASAWRNDTYRYGDYRLQNDENTMEPQEDVVEKRRVRRAYVSMSAPANNGGSPLAENLLFLAMLVGSICGLYRLIIYLLSQS